MVAPFTLDALREQGAAESGHELSDGSSDGTGPGQPEAGRRSGRRQRRAEGRRMGWVPALLVVLIVLVILVGGVGSWAGLRLSGADPLPSVTPALDGDVDVPAQSLVHSLPWPNVGQ